MGITCTLILLDEFDWGYFNTNKQKKSEEFIAEFGGELIGQWYGAMVFDIEKRGYLSDERKAIIKKYCDAAYYIMDTQLWDIKRLEL